MDRESAVIKERTANMPKTHPNYGSDFQMEAVNLLLSSGRPLKRVAEELGVSANSLRAWRNRALGKTRAAQAASAEPKGRSEAGFTDPAAEIRRLQREVEYLRRQREILKKAVSILSEDPQSGMR
jgi:transposase